MKFSHKHFVFLIVWSVLAILIIFLLTQIIISWEHHQVIENTNASDIFSKEFSQEYTDTHVNSTMNEKFELKKAFSENSLSEVNTLQHLSSLNESVFELNEKLDLLNKTLLWMMENDSQKREWEAAQKEEDKHFPFDPQLNNCYRNFILQNANSTDTNLQNQLSVSTETAVSRVSTCVLLLRRSSMNNPRVEGTVHLKASYDHYRISVAGTMIPHSKEFSINIYVDDEGYNNILHMNPRMHQRKIAFSSRFLPYDWTEEIFAPLNGISPGKDFKIVITSEDFLFNIMVNDKGPIQLSNDYPGPKSTIRRIEIHEPVNIRLLTFEIFKESVLMPGEDIQYDYTYNVEANSGSNSWLPMITEDSKEQQSIDT